jgi:ligand-binding SRPBCC domain-containing protein
MAIHTLRREQFIPRPLEEVFAFFADARNLAVITPEWLNFQILTPEPVAMRPGTRLDYRLKWHGLPIRWQTGIEEWNPPHGFTDVQLRGPYRRWHHAHTFVTEPKGARMLDVVRYELPLGPFGDLAHAITVRRDLERVFDYRSQAIERLFPTPRQDAEPRR